MLQQPHYSPKINPLYMSIYPISILFQILYTPTLSHKSIFTNIKDPISDIWGPWGSNQSPETSQNTPNIAKFSQALFEMVKIMMWRPQFVHIPATTQISISPTPRDHESHISSPWGPPIRSQKQPKIPLTRLYFF